MHRGAFDVDGVLGNFTELYLNAVRAATGRDIPKDWLPAQWDIDEDLGLTEKERKATWDLINLPGQADFINPYPGAVEGIKKLSEIVDIFFVTSPVKSSPTWTYDRNKWLKRYFGKRLAGFVLYTEHKYTAAADFFVDDKPSHCEEWSEAWPHGKALLWTAGYNHSFQNDRITRVQNFDDVARQVAMLSKSKYKPVNRDEDE